jgi:mannose-6-phosphate isomerase-like protein (cupin superfamily)
MLKPALMLFAVGSICAAQGPPATYKSSAELVALAKAKLKDTPEMGVAGVETKGGYHINVVSRNKPGPAGMHATGPAKGTELHYILDGSATVVTGGKVVRPANGPSYVEGGVEQHVTKGDIIVIQPNSPHWYKQVDGSVTYLEVRFDVENAGK